MKKSNKKNKQGEDKWSKYPHSRSHRKKLSIK